MTKQNGNIPNVNKKVLKYFIPEQIVEIELLACLFDAAPTPDTLFYTLMAMLLILDKCPAFTWV
jgi:hypothetical protein